jgi:hypothetical protein
MSVRFAAISLVQAVLAIEFVLAGLSKAVTPDFVAEFRAYVSASPGGTSGPLAGVVQSLVVPNAAIAAHLAMWTELVGGAILLLAALEVLRRWLSEPIGARHGYEPVLALISAGSATLLAGMSLVIYLLEGGGVPTVSPEFALSSPIAIELFLVPVCLGIAWLEFARFQALSASTE